MGKDLSLCVPHEAHFFPSALMLVWIIQPSFEIDMYTSIWSIRNSMPVATGNTILGKKDDYKIKNLSLIFD